MQLFSIIAFSVLASYSDRVELEVKCSDKDSFIEDFIDEQVLEVDSDDNSTTTSPDPTKKPKTEPIKCGKGLEYPFRYVKKIQIPSNWKHPITVRSKKKSIIF